MQVEFSGSIPDNSRAREAQLVEQSIEAILVVSSSLAMSNGCAEIGKQVPFRQVYLQVQILSPIKECSLTVKLEASTFNF